MRRHRLQDRLDAGVRGPFTMVVAPAGTGKTVLVSSWASAPREPVTVVWLSLDEDAARPTTFWRLLVTGLARQEVDVAAAPLQQGGEGAVSMVTAIADGVLAHPQPVVLVLDCDASLSADVTADLDHLVRRAGGRLRLVLLAREDPLLPLHRYRLAGAMVELRMADLAFTVEEGRALLAGAGIVLSESALAATMSRTQGWAAGLRMAAMFLAHHADRDEAASRFAGDSGTVAEYLLAEVLNSQPDGVRQLLLDTSVVDVLRPGLASALAGPHAERALSFLVHGNAFLEELPDFPGRYRYHALFRELLRAQLAYESPARAVELHRIAAAWLAEHALVVEAVRHAVLIRDWESAARYAVDDLSIPALLTAPQTEALHEALAKIPPSAEGTAVSVVSAARAVAAGDWKGAAVRLQRARELLDRSPGDPWPAGELAVALAELVRAGYAGDTDAALTSAATVQSMIPVQDSGRLAAHPELGTLVQTHRGAALVLAGRPDDAADAFAAAAANDAGTGVGCVVDHALTQSALLAALRGDLTLSAELATRVLPASPGAEPVYGAGAAEAALAYVHTERYDLAAWPAARRAGERVRATSDGPAADGPARAGTGPHPPRGRRPRRRLGRPRRGADQCDACRAGSPTSSDSRRSPCSPLRVTARAQPTSHASWVRSAARAADQARTVRRGSATPGPGPEQQQRPRRRTLVDELVQSATQHVRDGHEAPAVEDLQHALRLAAPELARRPFREAPPELWRLLREHDEMFVQHAWLTDEHAAGPEGDRRLTLQPPVRHVLPLPDLGMIYEPLTEKEREVLAHLSDLLSTQEIAATMFISVNTVRTHVRNILRKLAASRRNEAVRRARQLGVIDP